MNFEYDPACHKRSNVKELLDDDDDNNEAEVHSCPECSKSFRRKFNLNVHWKSVHQGYKRQLVQPACQKDPQKGRTRNPKNYQTHKILQDKELKFKDDKELLDDDDNDEAGKKKGEHTEKERCLDCGKIFKNSQSLYGHRRDKHTREAEVHSCPECGKSFGRKFNLQVHRKSVHQGYKLQLVQPARQKDPQKGRARAR